MKSLSCLTEVDLPLSPIFIDFISRRLDGADFKGERWSDQTSEDLINLSPTMRRRAAARLERLVLDESAQQAISTVYRWFHDLSTARWDAVREMNERFQFISIVGLARTGGSYLTAELFVSLGYDPSTVPSVIAHDGFPDAQPLSLTHGSNQWIGALLSLSEYLTMIDIYFASSRAEGPIVVPKKLTKGVYAAGLFNAVLGVKAEYVVTIRHPIASCISSYEKSGGFPRDGRYKSRSNIETWIKRDQMLTGVSPAALDQMDYFDAYVRYWEQYYINLAMSGLTANRSCVVVPFGKSNMERTAMHWRERFGSARKVSEFVSTGPLDQRHPEWIARSRQAIERVAAVWELVQLPFPFAELNECF